MTFLQPLMLWSLLALVPLAAFYFLKVRPRRKPTTAFFLWEKLFEERRSTSLFQRLRDIWSLLLLAVACAAICFALARPEWTDRRQDLLILIDNSASMAAQDRGTARIDLAKRAAAEIVEGLNDTQRVAVATVAQKLVYRSHLTDNPRELLDAIDSVAVAHQQLSPDALPKREGDEDRYLREHRVLFLSDGCFGAERLPEHIELVKIGESLENVGIVAADMAYLPSGVNRLAFYCQVASSFSEPREVDLIVARVDDRNTEQIARVIPLEIKPGVNLPETFTLDNALPGKWIARLQVDDALTLDNAAYLVATHPDPVRVAVKSEDRFFLENSVLAFSRAAGLLTLVGDKPDVVVANRAVPNDEKTLLFHPTGDSCWWTDLGEVVEVVAPRVVINSHPSIRHLDPGTMAFVGARRLTAPAGAQVIVADDNGTPLIYAARHEDRSAIVVNMDPVAADFYFSAAFPVLVHSAATYLAGRESTLAATYRPGDSVPIPAASETSQSTWTTSSNEKTDVQGKWLTLDDRLGYSELRNDSGQWPIGVSLLAASETMLDSDSSAGTTEPLSRGRSPAHWLAILAIVVLATESILYDRRKVG